jgi:peptidoglycan/xylan/chitin deacetylase (PgdA/CDA1 family)
MEAHPQETKHLASIPYFELANHSYLHPHMTKLSPDQQFTELAHTQKIMFRLVGRYASAFRPPFGEFNDSLVRAAAKAGMCTVTWDISTGDPDRNATVEDLMYEFRKVRPGSVVLMHANGRGWKTDEALPSMVKHLANKKLTPVTMAELLALGTPMAPSD